MTGRTAFAYAQARVQARYGRLAGPGEWHRVERVGDFGQLVQLAQGTGLRPWVAHVGPDSDVHHIELALRHHFRDHVRRVTGWLPVAWQPAALWTSVLVDLPAVSELLDEGPPPGWMRNDPLYAPLAAVPGADRRTAFRGSLLAPLAGASGDPAAVARRWREHWRALWPSARGPVRRPLERLAGVLPEPAPVPGELRFLGRTVRREIQRPAAVFAYLGLVRRELERLRGLLARRRLLPQPA